MTKKPKKKKKSLTSKQRKAINQVSKYPDKSDAEISKDLMELGVIRDRNYLTNTTRNNKQIRDIIAIKREKYQLRVTNQMPAALQVTRKALKDNNLKAAALVFKHALPTQDDAPVRQPMIHVETLNLVRGNQLLACQDKLDAIEVQENGNDNK